MGGKYPGAKGSKLYGFNGPSLPIWADTDIREQELDEESDDEEKHSAPQQPSFSTGQE